MHWTIPVVISQIRLKATLVFTSDNSGLFRLASVEFSKCAARAKVQASNLATSGCLLASKFQALLAQGLVSLKVKVEH